MASEGQRDRAIVQDLIVYQEVIYCDLVARDLRDKESISSYKRMNGNELEDMQEDFTMM